MLIPGQVKLPICTVILPCYNYGRWIDTAIQSVIDQDYPDKQLIIVNDGSTDNSYELICNYLEKVTGKLVREPDFDEYEVYRTPSGMHTYLLHTNVNRERSHTRNTAIKFSLNNTHIYALLDADDYFVSTRLSKCIAKILEYPDKIGVVYTDNLAINVESGHNVREIREPFSERIVQHNMVHSAGVFTRNVVEKIGLFDENITGPEDFDYFLRSAKHFMIVHIPEALIVTRTHKLNSTNTLGQKWHDGWARIAEKLRNG